MTQAVGPGPVGKENDRPASKPTGRPGSPRASEADLSNPHLQLQHSPSFEYMKHGLETGRKSLAQLSRHSTHSDRIRILLSYLEDYDSLYLCPVNRIPNRISSRVTGIPCRLYEIKDYYGQTCFYAVEISSKCCLVCCSNDRTFQIYMYTTEGELIFECERECTVALCLCGVDFCLSGGIETSANFRHGEHYIGGVVSYCTCSGPYYVIQNRFWDDKFHLRGPKCSLWFPCRLCGVKEFIIYKPLNEIPVGKIIKGYDGLEEDRIPNKGVVGIIFPPRCSPELKACLVSAGFMLDVTYFNKNGVTCHRFFRYFYFLLWLAAIGGIIAVIALYQIIF